MPVQPRRNWSREETLIAFRLYCRTPFGNNQGMGVSAEVAAILAEAERRLGELAADAFRRREYATVAQLSAIAQRVASAADGGAPGMVATPVGRREVASAGATDSDGDGSVDGARIPGVMPAAAPPAKREHETFPRFARDGEALVKIGYSKSDRRTYEHRSPREVLDRLAGMIAELGGGGRRFTTEQLLPPDEQRLADVPSYQVYLCLAFLVRRGLIRRHGRAGYTVAGEHGDALPAGVAAAWDALPAH